MQYVEMGYITSDKPLKRASTLHIVWWVSLGSVSRLLFVSSRTIHSSVSRLENCQSHVKHRGEILGNAVAVCEVCALWRIPIGLKAGKCL